jgi:hypothetical protein
MSSQRRLYFLLLDFDSDEVQQYALTTLMPGVPLLFIVTWDINTDTVLQRVEFLAGRTFTTLHV